MNLQDIATILGMVSILITGANFVALGLFKTFWSLTFTRKEKSDEERFKKIEKDIAEHKIATSKDKEENEAFRHEYKTTVKGLYVLIESKFKDFDRHFDDFKELVVTKIDLAISKNLFICF